MIYSQVSQNFASNATTKHIVGLYTGYTKRTAGANTSVVAHITPRTYHWNACVFTTLYRVYAAYGRSEDKWVTSYQVHTIGTPVWSPFFDQPRPRDIDSAPYRPGTLYTSLGMYCMMTRCSIISTVWPLLHRGGGADSNTYPVVYL